MEGNVILVPIHLDAYLAEDDTSVSGPHADFSKLPYVDSEKGDVNSDHPYLSESIVAEPFENRDWQLKKGLHLHWSLPDAMTKGTADKQGENAFPAVPNRWLVTRKRNGVKEGEWMVESDYLHPVGQTNEYDSITYPVDGVENQPFRYLGRHLEYKDWEEDDKVERLPRLTAMGYGEPTFAAIYPNCHSVFGYFDKDISEPGELKDLSYQVIGWYADSGQDLVRMHLADKQGWETADVVQYLKETFRWSAPMSDGTRLPQRTICHAEVTFNPHTDIQNDVKESPVRVSVGNSGTEALSAMIAEVIDGRDKPKMEEQLESLLLHDELAGKSLDHGHRFKEARHRKGFKPGFGAELYELTLPKEEQFVPAQVKLPQAISSQLDQLNALQKAWVAAKDHLARQRHLLFADWYKYLLSAYPEEALLDQYPDVDQIRLTIKRKILDQLAEDQQAVEAARASIAVSEDELNQSLERFTNGVVEAMQLQVLLNTGNAATAPFNFHLVDAPNWESNAPFSGHALNMETGHLSFSDQNGTVQAISMWVNITPGNLPSATLLYTESADRIIARDRITDCWSRVVIDRKDHPTDQALTWAHLPKGRWTYLYIEFKIPIAKEETIFLFGYDESSSLKASLAGLRTFGAGLTREALAYDRNMLGHATYQLKQVAGPRFWEPKEPVIMLEGEAVTPTRRHGMDQEYLEEGLLPCLVPAPKKVTSYQPSGINLIEVT